MKAAIYARYSSENQSEKSIDDQVRVCKNYAAEHDCTIDEKHIYIDEALSGSLVNRPGLQALEKAAEAKEFDAVLVDDLSRLSRSNHQMLTIVLKFNYYQVKIISVADGITTADENSKLGIQVRGLINELYLDDLSKKTMRGQEGQKLRGFSAGERVYGYYTAPVGEMKLNRKGQARYEGMVHKINPEEAEIVKKIFTEFAEGKSIHTIAVKLNEDNIPTKRKYKGGWNISTLSKILKNQKYIGTWNWRTTKFVRDPMTGRKKKIVRPEKEIIPLFREDLIIISKDLWEKVQKRWSDIKGTWPVSKKRQPFYQQKSYVHTSPNYLFSGLMKCNSCGGAIVLLSGKGSGYYGCYNSRRKTCQNMLLVPRKRIEQTIIAELTEKIMTTENIEYVYKRVEKVAAEGLNTLPDLMKTKKLQYEKLQQEIQNYLNFVRMGNFSKTVSEALSSAEKKNDDLTREIGSLEFQEKNSFKAPPKEWIDHRLANLRDTLNKDTVSSAVALKELLGEIRLEAVMEKELTPEDIIGENKELKGIDKGIEIASATFRWPRNDDINGDSPIQLENNALGQSPFKPYYIAHTKIQTLALLDEEHKGSNWYYWRRGRDLNPRTP